MPKRIILATACRVENYINNCTKWGGMIRAMDKYIYSSKDLSGLWCCSIAVETAVEETRLLLPIKWEHMISISSGRNTSTNMIKK